MQRSSMTWESTSSKHVERKLSWLMLTREYQIQHRNRISKLS